MISVHEVRLLISVNQTSANYLPKSTYSKVHSKYLHINLPDKVHYAYHKSIRTQQKDLTKQNQDTAKRKATFMQLGQIGPVMA
jgi:hypothetical protein